MDDIKVILGTMAIGNKLNKQDTIEFLNFYKNRGYNELDTAIMYGNGKTEVILGQVSASKNFKIATKVNPWFENGKSTREQKGSLNKEGVSTQIQLSLSRLQTKSVDIFYLHAPDHNTPINETLENVQKLYEQGKFKIFALSNYSSWQVAQICEICKSNNWIIPSIYQGMYNVFTRDIENELIPCLRYYNIAFYAYNPLAGGLLTGKYNINDNPQSGRFSEKTSWGKAYRDRFWNTTLFNAMDSIKSLLEEHNTNILEVSIRWLHHHSILSSKYKDGIILGASSISHLECNLNAIEAKPLPDIIVIKLNEIAETLSSKYPHYYR